MGSFDLFQMMKVRNSIPKAAVLKELENITQKFPKGSEILLARKKLNLASFHFSDLLMVSSGAVGEPRASFAAPQGIVENLLLIRYENHLLKIRTAGISSALLLCLLVSPSSFSLLPHTRRLPVGPSQGIPVYLNYLK